MKPPVNADFPPPAVRCRGLFALISLSAMSGQVLFPILEDRTLDNRQAAFYNDNRYYNCICNNCVSNLSWRRCL